MQQAEARAKREAMEEDHKDPITPLDRVINTEKQYKVYFDEGCSDKPWSCYLTKVDLGNGFYGDYVFYKMQLLFDTNRELYVILTRYGRIGEEGMH